MARIIIISDAVALQSQLIEAWGRSKDVLDLRTFSILSFSEKYMEGMAVDLILIDISQNKNAFDEVCSILDALQVNNEASPLNSDRGATSPTVQNCCVIGREISQGDIRRYIQRGASGVVPLEWAPEKQILVYELLLSGELFVPAMALRDSLVGRIQEDPTVAEAMAQLTVRQRQVLQFAGHGFSNKNIGSELGISEATVKLHMNAILRALGVKNRTEAAILAARHGLI